MLFNSLTFAIFFPLVTVGYYLLPFRRRWIWLLAASAWFYMAFVPAYILILAAVIGVDYVAARAIEAHTEASRRRRYLMMSIAANVGMLAVFKYWNFGVSTLNSVTVPWLGAAAPLLHIALPIGLSFHTFQSLSYTIEVYRGRQAAERHLGYLALYVLFYPQLVAGPIERPQQLLPQLRRAVALDQARLVSGMRRMAWGLFKKLVIADRAALAVNGVFANPSAHEPAAVAVAVLLFGVQIYADFSGYTDIALGAAETMGITLMENFRAPYFAASLRDFWRRWHISLSSWFRDYVFIPLGQGHARTDPWARAIWCRNILVTFLLSGLWHGANWTFVAWGAMHGVWLCLESLTAGLRDAVGHRLGVRPDGPLRMGLGWVVTVSFVFVTWVFFRAATFGDAAVILRALPAGVLAAPRWGAALQVLGLDVMQTTTLVTGVVTLTAVDGWRLRHGSLRQTLDRSPAWVRAGLSYALVLVILAAGVQTRSEFIYFQF